MGDQTYNSLSTNIISTATVNTSSINALSVSTGTFYARTLTGDGASLSNLNYANFSPPTIPRTSFGAYSVPWNAMEREGSLTIDSGTWLINGFLAVNSLSVATTFEASGITATTISNLNTYTASLTSPVICSFYISTQALATDTVFFKSIYGNYAKIDSSVIGFLSTGLIEATGFDVQEFYAQKAQFSSLSTGAWITNNLLVTEINLFDRSSLTYSPLILSANTLYLNNSTIFSNVVGGEQLASTTAQLQYDLYATSNYLFNFLYPHNALSSLSSAVESNLSITQIAISSVCSFTAATSNFFSTALSNLSVSVDSRFVTLSNYTVNSISNVSTTITERVITLENLTASNFVATSNTFELAVSSLSTSFNLDLSNLSVNTLTTISNISTAQGADILNLYAGVSSVGFLMASGISTSWYTLSTQAGSNQSTMALSLSTAISNLSIGTEYEFNQNKIYLSTAASNLSTTFGSVFSSLNLGPLLSSVSSFSTVMGGELADIRLGISTSYSNLSTTAGSNFSSITESMFSSISSVSTFIGLNYTTMQLAVSTLSTSASSNVSTSYDAVMSSLSSYSTTISLNFITTQTAISSVSTMSGSNTSTLTQSLLSTISVNNYFVSTLQLSVSSISTAISYEGSTLRDALSTLSTSFGSNFSITQIAISSLSTSFGSNFSTTQISVSSLSTTIGDLSNISLLSFSTLSTTIGDTSNYLGFFSTVSTMIMSSFSTLSLGLSSISTTIGLNNEANAISITSRDGYFNNISTGNLRAGMIMTSSIFISTFSTSSGFFDSFQGSTMSSLTQQIGLLVTNKITASSFSGNLGDAMTLIIQRI